MYRLLLVVVAVLGSSVFPTPALGNPQQSDNKRLPSELTSQENAVVDALVESARKKELAGESAERAQLLEEAFAIAGTRHLGLNGIRGLVFENNQWMTPAEVSSHLASDKALAQYRAIRQTANDTFAGNCELALWCQEAGLANEARAHWLRALDFDIDNRGIRAQLGHVNIGNRWVTPEQIEAANAQAEIARQLLAKHTDDAKKILRLLDSQSKKKRAQGLEQLEQITDPEWIIALELVFAPRNEEIAKVAIDRLAFFTEREATQALMRIALFNPMPTVRELAASKLGTREPSEYVPDLIAMLATPVTSQFSIQTNRAGGLLYQHLFTQQTDEKEIVRLTGANVFTENRGVVVARSDPRETMRLVRQSVAQARQMENMKEMFNQNVDQQNQVVIGVLSRALNLDLGNDPTQWWNWWNDHNEVYVTKRPLSYEDRTETVVRPPSMVELRPASSCECLVAGTKVWTSTGLVPIERLTVGDRVLARDVETGNLSFRSVIRPTIRPASPTLEIQLQGEVLKASGGHPFWVCGQGWVKARDLSSDMRIETVNGSAPVVSVKDSATVELYNLVVEKDANYFVGELGILSHDNTIPSGGTKSLLNRGSR